MGQKIKDELLLDIFRRHSQSEPKNLSMDSTIDELDIDSLAMVEIVFELEDRLEVDIDFNAHEFEIDNSTSLRGLSDALEAKIA